MDYRDFFSGKRITLMGLGLLGRGIGDAEFLAPLCKELVVTDLKSEAALATSLVRLRKYQNIRYALGTHSEADFTKTDMVLKAAGVAINSPYIAAARAAGVPVYMSTALFAKFAAEVGVKLVGITGTRGKSTVTHLIFQSLQRAGRNVHLGGNVRGLSTLALLPVIKKGDTAVLELDSWQLQGFGDLQLSPHIAVFTNLQPDHLNYYGGDMKRYFSDKANIFRHQTSGDHLIVGAEVLDRIRDDDPPLPPIVPAPLPDDWKLRLLGLHNRQNAALAACALHVLDLGHEATKQALESCEPVEGRLQKVADVKGITFYNDNNATTPHATIAALCSFDKPLTLICGGSDKAISLELLATTIADKANAVVLLPGSGTDRLRPSLNSYVNAPTMVEAVRLAMECNNKIILLSPGFASFGSFNNEYDRNDQYLKAISAL